MYHYPFNIVHFSRSCTIIVNISDFLQGHMYFIMANQYIYIYIYYFSGELHFFSITSLHTLKNFSDR